MPKDELHIHLKMRSCLAGILDLDRPGVAARIAEIDAEIERLRAVIEPGEPRHDKMVGRPIEIVSIGRAKAAA